MHKDSVKVIARISTADYNPHESICTIEFEKVLKVSAKARSNIAPIIKFPIDIRHEKHLPESPSKHQGITKSRHYRGRSADWVYSSNSNSSMIQYNEIQHHSYTFDFIFNSNMILEDILASEIVRTLAVDTAQGLNTSFLVFGGRRTGKTHTLVGSKENPGIIPHSLCELFRHIELERDNDKSIAYKIHLSVVEVRNTHIRSLLPLGTNHHSLIIPDNHLSHRSDHSVASPGNAKNRNDPSSSDSYRIDVREHPKVGVFLTNSGGNHCKGEHSIPSLTVAVTSAEEAISIISNCGKNKNEMLSTNNTNTPEVIRGHIFYTVHVEKRQESSGTNELTFSKMQFVEFATVDRSNPKTKFSKTVISSEVQEINRSLLTLGEVLQRLSQKVSSQSNEGSPISKRSSGAPKSMLQHVPYLDSKLTYLLKDALGGNSKTVVMATINDGVDEYEQTINTLNFVSRCKGIQNRVYKNRINLKSEELPNFQFESYFINQLKSKMMLEQEMSLFDRSRFLNLPRNNILFGRKADIKAEIHRLKSFSPDVCVDDVYSALIERIIRLENLLFSKEPHSPDINLSTFPNESDSNVITKQLEPTNNTNEDDTIADDAEVMNRSESPNYDHINNSIIPDCLQTKFLEERLEVMEELLNGKEGDIYELQRTISNLQEKLKDVQEYSFQKLADQSNEIVSLKLQNLSLANEIIQLQGCTKSCPVAFNDVDQVEAVKLADVSLENRPEVDATSKNELRALSSLMSGHLQALNDALCTREDNLAAILDRVLCSQSPHPPDIDLNALSSSYKMDNLHIRHALSELATLSKSDARCDNVQDDTSKSTVLLDSLISSKLKMQQHSSNALNTIVRYLKRDLLDTAERYSTVENSVLSEVENISSEEKGQNISLLGRLEDPVANSELDILPSIASNQSSCDQTESVPLSKDILNSIVRFEESWKLLREGIKSLNATSCIREDHTLSDHTPMPSSSLDLLLPLFLSSLDLTSQFCSIYQSKSDQSQCNCMNSSEAQTQVINEMEKGYSFPSSATSAILSLQQLLLSLINTDAPLLTTGSGSSDEFLDLMVEKGSDCFSVLFAGEVVELDTLHLGLEDEKFSIADNLETNSTTPDGIVSHVTSFELKELKLSGDEEEKQSSSFEAAIISNRSVACDFVSSSSSSSFSYSFDSNEVDRQVFHSNEVIQDSNKEISCLQDTLVGEAFETVPRKLEMNVTDVDSGVSNDLLTFEYPFTMESPPPVSSECYHFVFETNSAIIPIPLIETIQSSVIMDANSNDGGNMVILPPNPNYSSLLSDQDALQLAVEKLYAVVKVLAEKEYKFTSLYQERKTPEKKSPSFHQDSSKKNILPMQSTLSEIFDRVDKVVASHLETVQEMYNEVVMLQNHSTDTEKIILDLTETISIKESNIQQFISRHADAESTALLANMHTSVELDKVRKRESKLIARLAEVEDEVNALKSSATVPFEKISHHNDVHITERHYLEGIVSQKEADIQSALKALIALGIKLSSVSHHFTSMFQDQNVKSNESFLMFQDALKRDEVCTSIAVMSIDEVTNSTPSNVAISNDLTLREVTSELERIVTKKLTDMQEICSEVVILQNHITHLDRTIADLTEALAIKEMNLGHQYCKEDSLRAQLKVLTNQSQTHTDSSHVHLGSHELKFIHSIPVDSPFYAENANDCANHSPSRHIQPPSSCTPIQKLKSDLTNQLANMRRNKSVTIPPTLSNGEESIVNDTEVSLKAAEEGIATQGVNETPSTTMLIFHQDFDILKQRVQQLFEMAESREKELEFLRTNAVTVENFPAENSSQIFDGPSSSNMANISSWVANNVKDAAVRQKITTLYDEMNEILKLLTEKSESLSAAEETISELRQAAIKSSVNQLKDKNETRKIVLGCCEKIQKIEVEMGSLQESVCQALILKNSSSHNGSIMNPKNESHAENSNSQGLQMLIALISSLESISNQTSISFHQLCETTNINRQVMDEVKSVLKSSLKCVQSCADISSMDLKSLVHQLHTDIKTLMNKLSEIKLEYENNLNAECSCNANMKKEIDELNKNFAKLSEIREKERLESAATISDLKFSHNNLQTDLEHTEFKFSEQSIILNRLQALSVDMDATNKLLKDDNYALREKVCLLQTTITDLEETVTKLKNQNDLLHENGREYDKKYIDSVKNIERLQKRIFQLEMSAEELRQKSLDRESAAVRNIQTEMDLNAARFNSFKVDWLQRETNLCEQLKKIQTESNESTKRFQELTGLLHNQNEHNLTLQNELEQIKFEKTSQGVHLLEVMEQLEQVQQSENALQKNCLRLKSTIEQLKKETNYVESAADEKKKMIEIQYNSKIAELNKIVSDLTDQLKTAQNAAMESASSTSASLVRIEELQTELICSTHLVDSLKSEMSDRNAECLYLNESLDRQTLHSAILQNDLMAESKSLLEQLKMTQEDMNAQVQNKNATINTLQGYFDEMAAYIDMKEAEVLQQQTDLDQLTEKCATLEQQIMDATQHSDSLVQTLTISRVRLEEELRQKEVALSLHAQHMKHLSGINETLKAELSNQKDMVESGNAKVDYLEGILSATQSQQFQFTEKIENLTEQLNEKSAAITSVNEKLQFALKNNSMKQIELENLRLLVDSAEQKSVELEYYLGLSEEKVSLLNGEISTLHESHHTLNSSTNSLETELRALKQELILSKQLCEDCNLKLEALQVEYVVATNTIKLLSEQNAQLGIDVQLCDARIQSLSSSTNDSNELLSSLRLDLEAKTAEAQSYQSDLESIKNKYECALSEWESTRQVHIVLQNRKDFELQELESKALISQEKILNLNKKLVAGDAEAKGLKKEIDSQREQIFALEKEFDIVKLHLNETNLSLNEEMKLRKEQICDLERQLSGSKTECSEMKNQLQGKDKCSNILKDQHNEAMITMQAQISLLKNEIEQQRGSMSLANKILSEEVDQLRVQLHHESTDLESSKLLLVQSIQKHDKVVKDLESTEETLIEQLKENQRLQSELAAKSASLHSFNADFEAAKHKIASLENSLSEAHQSYCIHLSTVENLKGDADKLREQVNHLYLEKELSEATLADQLVQIASSEEKSVQRSSQLGMLQQELEIILIKHQDELSALNLKFQKATERIHQQEQKIQAYEVEISSMTNEITDKVSSVGALLIDSQEHLESLSTENARFQVMIVEKERQLESADAQLDQLNRQFEVMTSEYQKQLEAKEDIISQSLKTISSLQKEVSTLSAEIAEKEIKLQKLFPDLLLPVYQQAIVAYSENIQMSNASEQDSMSAVGDMLPSLLKVLSEFGTIRETMTVEDITFAIARAVAAIENSDMTEVMCTSSAPVATLNSGNALPANDNFTTEFSFDMEPANENLLVEIDELKILHAQALQSLNMKQCELEMANFHLEDTVTRHDRIVHKLMQDLAVCSSKSEALKRDYESFAAVFKRKEIMSANLLTDLQREKSNLMELYVQSQAKLNSAYEIALMVDEDYFTQVHCFKSAAVALKGQMTSLYTERDTLIESVDELESDMSTLEEILAAREQEIATAMELLEVLEREKQAALQEQHQLKDSLSVHIQTIMDLEQSVAEYESNAQMCNAKIVDLYRTVMADDMLVTNLLEKTLPLVDEVTELCVTLTFSSIDKSEVCDEHKCEGLALQNWTREQLQQVSAPAEQLDTIRALFFSRNTLMENLCNDTQRCLLTASKTLTDYNSALQSKTLEIQSLSENLHNLQEQSIREHANNIVSLNLLEAPRKATKEVGDKVTRLSAENGMLQNKLSEAHAQRMREHDAANKRITQLKKAVAESKKVSADMMDMKIRMGIQNRLVNQKIAEIIDLLTAKAKQSQPLEDFEIKLLIHLLQNGKGLILMMGEECK